jgi:apolipoprotein D and lipocalin family protein
MMLRRLSKLWLAFTLQACQSLPSYDKTVSSLEIERYMGKWYVIASRPTIFEVNAYNATETYSFNKDTGKIDVDFQYNKGALDGAVKSVPQSAHVFNTATNAHWKIGVWFLPFDLDYLIIALDQDYQWTVVGVPNQKYIWVMSRVPTMSESQLEEILTAVHRNGYNVDALERVPHG